jgi:hypothetical protein
MLSPCGTTTLALEKGISCVRHRRRQNLSHALAFRLN